jgi:hypothetical protein
VEPVAVLLENVELIKNKLPLELKTAPPPVPLALLALKVTELKIVEAAAHRLARSRIMDRPAISGWDALIDYCRTTMAHRETEQFRILFLDRKNTLIAEERTWGTSVTSAAIVFAIASASPTPAIANSLTTVARAISGMRSVDAVAKPSNASTESRSPLRNLASGSA